VKKPLKGHINHDRWLVSYADFITLLFAFFVVLYSTSKADQEKQARVANSIDSAFRALGLFQTPVKDADPAQVPAHPDGPASPTNIVMGDQLMASPAVQADFERIRKQLEGMLSGQIAQHIVSVRVGRDGLIISLREAGFYDSGSDIPHPASTPTINAIAEAIRNTQYDIRVEGHTDNIPIHTDQFASNWELSAARATRMTRILVLDHGFAPHRLSASGYAEFHPVASNSSPDGRSQNRRVDIIVLPRTSAAPPEESANTRMRPDPAASRLKASPALEKLPPSVRVGTSP
jgi:chemotaxis protein MotB